MLMECLIRRDGNTHLTVDKTPYTFQALRIDARGDRIVGPTTSICDVQKEAHVQYLLKTGQYREYQDKPAPVSTRPDPITEYDITLKDKAGYVVFDKKGKKYTGPDGEWKAKKAEVKNLFESEIDAFQWLKDYVEFGAAEQDEQEAAGAGK